MRSNSQDKIVRDPETTTAPALNERQIKYLGLIIEKEEEQLIEISEETPSQEGVYFMPEDPIKRQYFPIRDKYIRIVKSGRKLTIESFEKRGRKDFKRTCKSLYRLGQSLARESHQIKYY